MHAKKRLNIAVVGSGPAGSSTALFLNQQGFDVTVFDRNKIPKPIGAGFMLQPTGMLMLHKLGLLEKIASRATPINRLYGINEKNRKVLDLKFDYLKSFKHSLGIHRGLIFKVLNEELEKKNIPLMVGQEITSFKRLGDKIIPVDDQNLELGEFDLIVIANGSRSKLRHETDIKFNIHWYEWLAMWYVAKEVDNTIGNKIYHKYYGTNKLLGFMPIGLGPDDNNEDRLVNLFYSVPQNRLDSIKKGNIDAWKKEVLELDPIAEPYLHQISKMEDFTFTGYGRISPNRMHDDKIAVLGDAAHGMSPQLGQGVSMALLDACSLSKHLAENNVDVGLQKFSEDRMNHIKYYLWSDKMAAPLFQSHQFYQSYFRDIGLNFLQKLPFSYKILMETMIGIKTGVFGKKIKIDNSLIY